MAEVGNGGEAPVTTVFVTVGTDHHPFTRLMHWTVRATAQPGVTAIVQHGSTEPPQGVDAVEMMDVDDLTTALRQADLVVCHGGPGSIMEARAAGHTPIVVPREHRYGEHVDDHQVRFATRLAREGLVVLARDEDEFTAALSASTPVRSVSAAAHQETTSLDTAVATIAALVDHLVVPASRRPRRRIHRFTRTDY